MGNRRDELHVEIMNTQPHNQQAMFKLIRTQRAGARLSALPTVSFKDHVEGETQANKWASYFEDLATPTDHASFCPLAKQLTDSIYLLRLLLTDNSTIASAPLEHVSPQKVKSYVSQLKRGKAADYYGITSEHIQLASEEIVDVLTNVTNNILNTGKMPATMKTGIIIIIINMFLYSAFP